MPIARVQLPDGRIGRFEVPEGTTPEQAQSLIQAQLPTISQSAAPAVPELPESLRPRTAAPEVPSGARQDRSFVQQTGQFLGNLAAGAVRGAGSIGATIIRPFETSEENAARRQAMDEALRTMGAEPESFTYGVGKFGTEVAGTMGVGGAVAAPVKLAAQFAPRLAPVAQSLASSGFTAPTTAGKIAAGATTGAAGAGLLDPGTAITGAGVGAVVPFAGPLIAKGIGNLADLRQIPKNRTAKIAREALGPDLDQAVNALRNAPPGVSVAEATAKIQNPAWQAFIRDGLEKSPTGAQYLNKFATLTQEEGVNALSKLVGGTTAAEVRATTELAKQNLNKITTPMRESSLARGNLGKEVARLESMSDELGEQAAAKVQEVRRLIELGDVAAAAARLETIKAGLPASSRLAPAKSQMGFSDEFAAKFFYPGKLAQMSDEWASKAATASLDLGQGARFSQAAANALRSAGIKPLEGEPLVRSLKAVANNPEFAGNDVLLGSLRNVSDDIAKWTNSGGVIDLVALDAIRKNSVNAAIQQLRPGMDATSQRNAAAGVLARIRPIIDDAIEGSGGVGYRDYLATHAKGMQKIAEKELTGEALRLFKTDKDAFVRLVQNESTEAVEKILGSGKYNIAMELSEDTLAVLQAQAEKRLNQLAASKQATDGEKALTTLLRENTSRFRLPSWLSFWGAAANKTLSELEKAIGGKSMKVLAEAAQSPQGTVNLLESLPAAERSRVLQLIGNPSKWGAKGAATARVAGVNMLAPKQENQNALAEPVRIYVSRD